MSQTRTIFTQGWFSGPLATPSKKLPVFTHGWFSVLQLIPTVSDEVFFTSDFCRELVQTVGITKAFSQLVSLRRALATSAGFSSFTSFETSLGRELTKEVER